MTGTTEKTLRRARVLEQGVDGLLHDRMRPPVMAPIPRDRRAAITSMTQWPPPHEATHWTGLAMAGTGGIAVSTVRKIWKARGGSVCLNSCRAFPKWISASFTLPPLPTSAR
jgi:hypothetical protein